MIGIICVTPTPSGLCCNCGDEGILLRGETPITNDKGLTFCEPRCADEFETRTEREKAMRDTNCCANCGFDNWEHADDCALRTPRGWPGYRVTIDGHVESCRTSHGQLGARWRRLRPRPDKDGYLSVVLQRNGTRSTFKIAHLVLLVYVGVRPTGAVACHDPDPDVTNNAASNLRWDTQAGNIADKVRDGRQARGETHGMVRLTDEQVADIRRRFVPGARNGKPPSNVKDLAAEFGVTSGHIHALVKGTFR